MSFAKAGEPVTDEDGNVICYVKHDLELHEPISADSFHNFTEGNRPWVAHEPVDRRCVRPLPWPGGMQIRINGEWRP